MHFLKNLKISHKLIMFFLIVFILFTGLGLSNIRISDNVSKNIQKMYKSRVLSMSLLNEYNIKQKDLESLALQMLMTHDNKSKLINLIAVIDITYKDMEELLGQYENIPLDKIEKDWLAQLKKEDRSYYNSLKTTYDLILQNKQKEAYEYYLNYSSMHSNNINTLLRIMSDRNRKMAEEQYWEANRLINISLVVIYLTPFIGAFFILLLAYFINKNLTGPLKTLLDQIVKVADGDFKNLKEKIQVNSADEIGILAQSFNNMSHTIDNYMKILSEKNEIIKSQANQDPLTGLANRRMLNKKLMALIHESKFNNNKLAIFYIDLDNFKTINDTIGHIWGDRLLKEVAKRLRKCCGNYGFIARLGGDEFAVLVSNVQNEQEAENIADDINKAVSQAMLIGSDLIQITTSIGISIYPDHGENSITLFKTADAALYGAKRNGRNTFRIFNDESNNINLKH